MCEHTLTMHFSDADIEIFWSFMLLLAFWVFPSLLCYALVKIVRWLVFWYNFKNATISVDDLSLEDLRMMTEQTKKLYDEDELSEGGCGCDHGSSYVKTAGGGKTD